MTSATLDLIPVPSYDDLLGWVQRALPFSSTRIARMVYLFHAMPQLAAAELHGVFQPDTNLQPHLTIRRNTTGYLDVITHGTTFDCAIRDRMATGLFHVPGRGNVLFGLGAELALHVAYRPGSEFAVGPRDGEYLAVAGWPSGFVDLRVNPAGPLYAGHQRHGPLPDCRSVMPLHTARLQPCRAEHLTAWPRR